MATITKKWTIGEGSITATYNGRGNGSIVISTDDNEGIDRSLTLTVKSSDNAISKTITVNQQGKRQVFNTSDGNQFNVSDGGFYVLK